MAAEEERKVSLDSMLNVDALIQALRKGYAAARKPLSNADPTPFREVVNREAQYSGRAYIVLAGKKFQTRFERLRSQDEKSPMLRVIYYDEAETRQVALEVSTEELVLSTRIDPSIEPFPKQDLPGGMLKAPGADITIVNTDDLKNLKANKGLVRTQTYTLVRTEGQEVTLFYRPVRDIFLITDPTQKHVRIETVPKTPMKNLPYLSSTTAALIAKELDPFIQIGSLDFYKPVQVNPTNPLSKEVAGIIVNRLYPSTK